MSTCVNNLSSTLATAPTEDAERYECDVCGDEFSHNDGVIGCTIHFFCKECAADVINRSLDNLNEFPASCCPGATWSPTLIDNLISQDIFTTYMLKLRAHQTAMTIRVYCVNPACSSWLPPRDFDNSNSLHTIARCPRCTTTTCVGCKKIWNEQGHNCDAEEDPHVQPDWLPPYTPECRIKRCPEPSCRNWLEHQAACNHMTCADCQHEFCFICLLVWEGFHDDDGCPSYKDPTAGYDEQGYELTTRGLHRMTGLDRDGNNRLNQASDRIIPTGDRAENHEDGYGNQGEHNDEETQGMTEEEEDLQNWDEYQEADPFGQVQEGAANEPLRPGEEEYLEVEVEDTEQAAPHNLTASVLTPVPTPARMFPQFHDHFPPVPTFHQLTCTHDLQFLHTVTRFAWCRVCKYRLWDYGYQCQKCYMYACNYCHWDFQGRFNQILGEEQDLLTGPIAWAEQGYVPFRKDQQGFRLWLEKEDVDWGIFRLVEEYENLFDQLNPFVYDDFGIALMHEVAEEDHEQNNHFVAVEYRFGVGHLRIDRNRYSPLVEEFDLSIWNAWNRYLGRDG